MADRIIADTYFVTDGSAPFQQYPTRRRQITALGGCGFTLIELIVVTTILGVLTLMAFPVFSNYIRTVKNGACAADIRVIDKAIQAYVIDKNALPNSLDDVGMGEKLDPWKRLYVYQDLSKGAALMNFAGIEALNTDYDLYSKGEDGASTPASGNPGNEDDIVRSNDGVYVGTRP